MSQSNARRKGFTATAALTRGERVKLSGGEVVVAGVGEEGIGTVLKPVDAGLTATVFLDNPSVEVDVSGNISSGDDCYAAAAGKVAAAASGRRIGISLETKTDGTKMEMMLAGVNS